MPDKAIPRGQHLLGVFIGLDSSGAPADVKYVDTRFLVALEVGGGKCFGMRPPPGSGLIVIGNDVGKGAQLELAEHINHQRAMDEINAAHGVSLRGVGKELEAAPADEGCGNKSHRDGRGGIEQLSPVHVLYLNQCMQSYQCKQCRT